MNVRTIKKVGIIIGLGIGGFLTIAGFVVDYLAGLFFALLTIIVLIIILVATKKSKETPLHSVPSMEKTPIKGLVENTWLDPLDSVPSMEKTPIKGLVENTWWIDPLDSVPSMEKTPIQGYGGNQETSSPTRKYRCQELSDFGDLSWQDMEHLVGKLFEKKGYEVRVTQETADGGIDVEAKNATEFIGIQVKHWKNNVGFEDCAKTLGVSHKYNKAIIISTKSGFTPNALKFQEDNKYRLELWDTHRFRKELEILGISASLVQPASGAEKAIHNTLESKQSISKSTKVALFFFFLGIIYLVFADFFPNTWFVSIPLLTIAILIPLIKFMWRVAGWASNKVEEIK